MEEVFEYGLQGRMSSRNNYARLKVPFRKSSMEEKSVIYWPLSLEQISKFNEKKHWLK